MRIGVNCGHTISGPGCGASGIFSESLETRSVGRVLMDILRRSGVDVVDCTIDQANTQAEYLAAAVALANRQDLDWFISIHFNASSGHTGHGVEVYTYEGRQYQDALNVCRNISALGFRNRGVKSGSGLYVVKKTKAKSMLIEVCFCDHQDDAALYRQHGEEKIAMAIFDAMCSVGAVPASGTEIMGSSILTEDQIMQWMVETGNRGKDALHKYFHLPKLYLEEGAAEGVRGDLAFCQAVHETGYFEFGGDVVPEQHNFAGLGTTGGGVKGCYFPDDCTGVRAQIQHLKGYASSDPLVNACVDPRYSLISPHGKARTFEELSGKWAVPGYDAKKYTSLEAASEAGETYGQRILRIYDEIRMVKDGPAEAPGADQEGGLYANIAGFSKTEAECIQFSKMLQSHGINTQSWYVNPIRQIQ